MNKFIPGACLRRRIIPESDGEAAIINSLGDVNPYIIKASKGKQVLDIFLKRIFMLALSAVVRNLLKKQAPPLYLGQLQRQVIKPIQLIVERNSGLAISSLKTLHTPSHSLESTTWLLKDENGNDYAIFTGNTFIYQ